VWPVQTTDFVNMDDQTRFKPGQLGAIRQNLTPNEKDPKKRRYQEVPGDWINAQMRRSRKEFVTFKAERKIYNKKKAQYNGSLRL